MEMETVIPETAEEEIIPQQAPQPSLENRLMETQLRAQALFAQAQAILLISGMDVMSIFETDVEVRQKVLSGEWDFLDVWKQTAPRTPAPPAPVRSANGSMGNVNIGAMNSRQFEKLNEIIERGGKIDMM